MPAQAGVKFNSGRFQSPNATLQKMNTILLIRVNPRSSASDYFILRVLSAFHGEILVFSFPP